MNSNLFFVFNYENLFNNGYVKETICKPLFSPANVFLSNLFVTYRLLTSIVADGMVEENNMLVPKIPFGVSGTALAASLLRDGWSVGY